MRQMCQPYWGEAVQAWPVGIDTDRWSPDPATPKEFDFVLYNKIRWDHARREAELLAPIRHELERRHLRFVELRYGHYRPEQLRAALRAARAMVFVCEHETQGLAYQQALACGVPLLAWDHGGEWLDPSYHPHRVRFGPISSVPYWDESCGVRFAAASGFSGALDELRDRQQRGTLDPRQFILENLTLEKCALAFVGQAEVAAMAPDLPAKQVVADGPTT
jgi:glycosyltransferase involved in cell wall biosynthesis